MDRTAFQLVIEMRKSPQATLSELAQRLNVAPNTVKSKQEYLRQQGIIRDIMQYNDPVLGLRETTEVVAQYSPHKLGLSRVQIVFTNAKEIKKINKILGDHPYTYYQTNGIGYFPIIYSIFYIPEGTFQYLVELVEKMKILHYFDDYFLLQPAYSTNSFDNLKLWDENPNWDITIDLPIQNEISIETAYNQFVEKSPEFPQKLPIDETPNLDDLDLMLIRELTINSKISPTTLAQYYDRDRTTLSRRLNSIKNEYILNYSLGYNRKAFNLDSVFLIHGKLGIFTTKALFNLVEEGYIPYQSQFFVDEQGYFIWHLFAPTSFCNSILFDLLHIPNEIHLSLLNPIKGHRYFFYPNNYDIEHKKWKDDHDYIANYTE